MKVFEIIFAVLATIGIAFKVLRFPGAGPLIALSLTALSTFYFWFSYAYFNRIPILKMFKKKEIEDERDRPTGLAIVLGIGLSIVLIGSLFKIQFWPGAEVNLIVGLLLTVGVLIGVSVLHFSKKSNPAFRMLKRIAIIGGLGLTLYLVPNNSLVDVYYRSHPEYAEMYKRYIENPDSLEIRKEKAQLEYEIWGWEIPEELK